MGVSTGLAPRILHTTVYITPPWGAFPRSIARQARGYQYRTMRLRKALGETFPTPTVSAPILFQLLRRYRAWKIGPEGVISSSYTVRKHSGVRTYAPGIRKLRVYVVNMMVSPSRSASTGIYW